MSVIEQFMGKLRASLDATTFIKLTLSQPRNADNGVRNVFARVIELRRGRKLSLLFRHATHDVTKNFDMVAGADQVATMLGSQFAGAHLFTTVRDWELRYDAAGDGALRPCRPTFTAASTQTHDRRKTRLIPEDAPFFRGLEVTNAAGKPRPGMADKLRQIQRFVEILGHLVDTSPVRDARNVRVSDLGAGKGYLTFAAHEFFRRRGVIAEVTGLEMRKELVRASEELARKLDCEGLHFVCGTIGKSSGSSDIDVLIALHACDTATDDALHFGIRSGAMLMLVSPCCHKELRGQLASPPVLQDVLKHGILMEHQAEMLTDAVRALLLEIHGYDTRVFEFISTEHTAKNLMISAVKRRAPPDSAALRLRLRELLGFFEIREQRLARLLGEI
jgi:hypothetical protein